jgi:hypothetical protein
MLGRMPRPARFQDEVRFGPSTDTDVALILQTCSTSCGEDRLAADDGTHDPRPEQRIGALGEGVPVDHREVGGQPRHETAALALLEATRGGVAGRVDDRVGQRHGVLGVIRGVRTVERRSAPRGAERSNRAFESGLELVLDALRLRLARYEND